jgi:hypothetical protein
MSLGPPRKLTFGPGGFWGPGGMAQGVMVSGWWRGTPPGGPTIPGPPYRKKHGCQKQATGRAHNVERGCTSIPNTTQHNTTEHEANGGSLHNCTSPSPLPPMMECFGLTSGSASERWSPSSGIPLPGPHPTPLRHPAIAGRSEPRGRSEPGEFQGLAGSQSLGGGQDLRANWDWPLTIRGTVLQFRVQLAPRDVPACESQGSAWM